MSIIIPAAGLGRRTRSYGSKSMLFFRDEYILQRQLRILKEVFPTAKVVVVGGYEAERLRKILPADTKLIINRDFDTTNVSNSICMGLAEYQTDRSLIVYGDLIFNANAILPFKGRKNSCVLVDNTPLSPNSREVGANVIDGRALYFSYGLPSKWFQICLLAGAERHLFQKIASQPDKHRYFAHEVLNLVLEYDITSMDVVTPIKNSLVEVDCLRDIDIAYKLLTK